LHKTKNLAFLLLKGAALVAVKLFISSCMKEIKSQFYAVSVRTFAIPFYYDSGTVIITVPVPAETNYGPGSTTLFSLILSLGPNHTLIQILMRNSRPCAECRQTSPIMQRKILPTYTTGFLPVSAGIHKTAGFFRS